MKTKIKIFLLFAFFISILNTYAAFEIPLTINYSTVGTKTGYDHFSKMMVFVDGVNKGQSTVQKQSIANSVTVIVPTGSHKIKAVFYAKQGSVWEERTLENNYSFDCIYEKTLNLYNNTSIDIIFDFNKSEMIIKEPVVESKYNSVMETLDGANTSNSTQVGNYQSALQKVNDYLKTFDDGYYGYLEIKDGYLYDRFKSGKYCKVKMSDLDKAVQYIANEKVIVKCKTSKCVYSTYTDAYHDDLSFSQNADFNTGTLISLLNNLINTYNNKPISNTTTNNSNGDYQSELQKVNDYLKYFDNGYYGYLEIKDGYLYDRFKSGEHSKVLMTDLGKAIESEIGTKVVLKCKADKQCVFSTYTDAYHGQMSFSQSKSFNTAELITLLNNLVNAYNKPSTKTQYNTTQQNNKNGNTGDYTAALKKLNDYLKTFDNGYYGYFEVKDGYIYDRFKAGKYNKFKMEDMEGAVIQEQYKRVIFKCKGDDKCISTDWKENGREEYSQFLESGTFNYQELADLLNNFKDAYLGSSKQNSSNSTTEKYTESSEFLDGLYSNIDVMKSNSTQNNNSNKPKTDAEQRRDKMLKETSTTTSSTTTTQPVNTSTSSSKYAAPLKALNDYLKIFNPETYDRVEVKDNKVYFYFKVSSLSYNTSIKISDLTQNTTILIAKAFTTDEVKIFCKNDAEYFYSTYSQSSADHFRFFSYSVKDLTKMKQLVENFVNSLK